MRLVDTEIPTIIDPSATVHYPSATGLIIVGISVEICTKDEDVRMTMCVLDRDMHEGW